MPHGQPKKKGSDKKQGKAFDQQQEKHFLIGYDGKKVEVKCSSQASSSSSSQSSASENKALKEAVKFLLSIPAVVKNLVAVEGRASPASERAQSRKERIGAGRKAQDRDLEAGRNICFLEEWHECWHAARGRSLQEGNLAATSRSQARGKARERRDNGPEKGQGRAYSAEPNAGARGRCDETSNGTDDLLCPKYGTKKHGASCTDARAHCCDQRWQCDRDAQQGFTANDPQTKASGPKRWRYGWKERTFKLPKRSAETANLAAAEIMDLETQEIRDIFATIPEPHRGKMVAIVRSEPSS